MPKVSELSRNAWKEYRAARYQDAALLWLQASDQARELGNTADWYTYRVWAAAALYSTNQYAKAMDLLLEVRMHEPPDRPDYEAWIAQKKLINIVLDTQPQFERLQGYLDECQQLSKRKKLPAGDIPKLEGDLFFHQGDFQQAHASYEKAWTDDDELGYTKFCKAYSAVRCCLYLNQIKAAKDWHRAGLNTQKNFQDRLIVGAEIELHIALAEPNWAALNALLSQLDSVIAGSQGEEATNLFNQLSVRVHLLDPAKQDPMQASHLAQQHLLRPLLSKKNVHNQFGYRLLMLDFRLAALRFIVGMEAVDDLYYAKPQSVPKQYSAAMDQQQYQQRLQRALASCHQADWYGRRIDNMLQCEYRQQAVAKRRQRIQEIENIRFGVGRN